MAAAALAWKILAEVYLSERSDRSVELLGPDRFAP
jgi:hypothetical protein